MNISKYNKTMLWSLLIAAIAQVSVTSAMAVPGESQAAGDLPNLVQEDVRIDQEIASLKAKLDAALTEKATTEAALEATKKANEAALEQAAKAGQQALEDAQKATQSALSKLNDELAKVNQKLQEAENTLAKRLGNYFSKKYNASTEWVNAKIEAHPTAKEIACGMAEAAGVGFMIYYLTDKAMFKFAPVERGEQPGFFKKWGALLAGATAAIGSGVGQYYGYSMPYKNYVFGTFAVGALTVKFGLHEKCVATTQRKVATGTVLATAAAVAGASWWYGWETVKSTAQDIASNVWTSVQDNKGKTAIAATVAAASYGVYKYFTSKPAKVVTKVGAPVARQVVKAAITAVEPTPGVGTHINAFANHPIDYMFNRPEAVDRQAKQEKVSKIAAFKAELEAIVKQVVANKSVTPVFTKAEQLAQKLGLNAVLDLFKKGAAQFARASNILAENGGRNMMQQAIAKLTA